MRRLLKTVLALSLITVLSGCATPWQEMRRKECQGAPHNRPDYCRVEDTGTF